MIGVAKHLRLLVACWLAAATATRADVVGLKDRWTSRYRGLPMGSPATRPAAAYEDASEVMLRLAEDGEYWAALSVLDTALSANKGRATLARAMALNGLGDYSGAADVLREGGLLAGTPMADAAVIELARSQWGRADEKGRADAVATLRELARISPQAAVQLADYLIALGRPDEATVVAAGVCLNAAGEPVVEAEQAAKPGVKWDDAAWATAICRATDIWATQTGAYGNRAGLQQAVYARLVKTFDSVERSDLSARIEAARFALARDDATKAQEDLKAVLSQAPHHREGGLVSAAFFLAEGDADKAMKIAGMLLAANPADGEARLLMARGWLILGQPAAALEAAGLLTASSSANATETALLAVALGSSRKEAEAKALLERWMSDHPHDGLAAGLAGHWLVDCRRFELAGWALDQAIAREPNAANWLAAQATRNIMQGQYAPAQGLLDKAIKLDPFNTAASNFRAILKVIQSMPRVESEHVELRYESAMPPLLAQLMVDYTESVYQILEQRYGTAPPGKVYVEVYATARQFAVRTTGTTFIPTVGASTGPCIAMVVPKVAGQTSGAFDWAQVLRHEMTHTFTLAASEQHISRWMTEGLAVCSEEAPMPWEWVPLLNEAVTNDRLIPYTRLDWTFLHPDEPADRQLAYAQSNWLCLFAIARGGTETPKRLVNLLAEGATSEQALERVTGLSGQTLREAFNNWCHGQVAGWGYTPETTAAYERLREQGQAQIEKKQWAEALTTWSKVMERRPMDPLPQQRLAGLFLNKSINRPTDALKPLWRLAETERSSNRFTKRIARIAIDAHDLPQARRAADLAVQQSLFDVTAHQLLLEVAGLQADTALTRRQEQIIAALSAEQPVQPEKP